MKRFISIAMVFVAVLLVGSSFVACANGSSPNSDSSYDSGSSYDPDLIFCFLPGSVDNVDSAISWYLDAIDAPPSVDKADTDFPFETYCGKDTEIIKYFIRDQQNEEGSKYIVIEFEDGTNKLYELEITANDVLLKATAESAS